MRSRRYVVLMFVFLACSPGGDQRPDDERRAAPAAEAAPTDSTEAGGPDSSGTPEVPRPAPTQTGTDAAAQVDRPARIGSDAAVPPAPSVSDVLGRHEDSLRAIASVVGVDSAACNGDQCIQVTVVRRTQSVLSQLPGEIDGYAVVVVEHRGGH